MKVIINSLPKSGTHLLGRLVDLLGFVEQKSGLTGNILRETHRNPILNITKRKRRAKGQEDGLWIDLDIKSNLVAKTWLRKLLRRIPDGGYICGHLPYTEELSEFLRIHGFQIVHITRDPRDVLVSYINFQRNKEKFPFHSEFKSIPDNSCIMRVLEGGQKNGIVAAPLKDRLANSIGWLSDKGVVALKFEQLIGHKGGGSDFDQLKAIEAVINHLGLKVKRERAVFLGERVFDRKSETFHKGLIGQWETFLNAEQKSMITTQIGNEIKEMGYV